MLKTCIQCGYESKYEATWQPCVFTEGEPKLQDNSQIEVKASSHEVKPTCETNMTHGAMQESRAIFTQWPKPTREAILIHGAKPLRGAKPPRKIDSPHGVISIEPKCEANSYACIKKVKCEANL